MKYSIFLALAIAEIRTTLRLVRTWILVIAAVSLMVYLYVLELNDHETYSSMSSSAASANARFVIGVSTIGTRTLSEYLLLLFQIGIVALAFDIRSRDIRDRIVDVIDSKPITNLELLSARLSSITFLMILVTAAAIGLLVVVGSTLEYFDLPYGGSIEPVSVISFLLMDLAPNLIFWGALSLFLAVLIRIRLVVFTALIGLALANFWITPFLPTYLAEALVGTTSMVIVPSDLAPEFTNGAILLQRLAMVLLAAGLVLASAAIQSRTDGSSKFVREGIAIVCLFFSVGIQSTCIYTAIEANNDTARIAAVHEAMSKVPRADILHIEGAVSIDPGHELDVEYRITFESPTEMVDVLLFAFNPGFRIVAIELDGEPVRHRFEDGLIHIFDPHKESHKAKELRIVAYGKPDINFAYLDSRLNRLSEKLIEGIALRRLGVRSALNDNSYVALMPAIKWYPTSGAAYGEEAIEETPRDQFTLDLTVDIPPSWSIAGPGAREILSESDTTRVRFAPNTTVPSVALLASRFARQSTDVAGHEFELLMNPKHLSNVSLFSATLPRLKTELEEILTRANDFDLPYPFGTFAVVEVPASLRVYGGGSRMNSVHALPGILLLRETGFPTANFESRIRSIAEETMLSSKLPDSILYRLLEAYFSNDFDGGNPFTSASRNFMNFQTEATGYGAIALSYLVDVLATKIITEREGFFSIYYAGSPTAIQTTAVRLLKRSEVIDTRPQTHIVTLRDYLVNRPQVWDGMLSTALVDLDFKDSPKHALDVLFLKVDALADALHDIIGADNIALLLSELRSRHAGGSYTYDDFLKLATEHGINLNQVLDQWLDGTELPGFQIHETETVRLADDDQGAPVYQTSFYLANEQPAPGVVEISFYVRRPSYGSFRSDVKPLLINPESYSRIALHSESAIEQIGVRPYLSLNRETFVIKVNEPDSWEPQNIEKMQLIEHEVDRRPEDDGSIVVDDLDPEFTIIGNEIREREFSPATLRSMASFDGIFLDKSLDQNLPAWSSYSLFESSCYRVSNHRQAWGKYRQAMVVCFPPDTHMLRSNFETNLPFDGRWSLDYFFPIGQTGSMSVIRVGDDVDRFALRSLYYAFPPTGSYPITIRNNDSSLAVEFDLAAASHGWNRLGEYQLKRGKVDVEVQASEQKVLHVDAIRWTPIRSSR